MSGIELIIRPFATKDVTPPKIVPFATATQIVPNVRLRIGETGATKTFHGAFSETVTSYTIKYPTEIIE